MSVNEYFYSTGNVKLLNQTLIQSIKTFKNYESKKKNEFLKLLENGMDYSILKSPRKIGTITMKKYIMDVLNKNTIRWCLENYEEIEEVEENNVIDEEFLRELKEYSGEIKEEEIEEEKSYVDQFKDARPLPDESRGHIVETTKIPQFLVVHSDQRENRDSTTPNEYTIKLQQGYRGVSEVKLIDAQIPVSGYIINDTNNLIHFSDDGANSLTATLTNGNYTVAALVTEIKAEMEAESLANGNTRTYTVTGDSTVTNKFTILQTAGTFSLLFNDGTEPFSNGTRQKYKDNSAAPILGYSPLDLTGASSYISQSVFDIDGPRGLYLEIEELGGRVQGARDDLSNVFAWVPIDANISEINYHMHMSDTKNIQYFSPPKGKLEKLTIRWRDDKGNVYDFNGKNHTFELAILSVDQLR